MKKKMFRTGVLCLVLVTLMFTCACGSTASTSATPEPTAEATAEPTAEPTVEPTAEPTPEPTAEPTPAPTPEPTEAPAEEASASDSAVEELLTAALEEYLGPDAAAVDCEPVDDNVTAVYQSDKGYGIVTQRDGHYEGQPITLLVIMDPEGTVQHISVLEAHETEGYGSNALTDGYLGLYVGGKTFKIIDMGDGMKIDTYSGATDTSFSVFKMVTSATKQVSALIGE